MSGKICVSLTFAKDNTDKATVAFVIANASVASSQETMVFLSTEAVRLAEKGYADDSPCLKKRGLGEDNLVDGALVVGGAKLVEFLSQGAASISY